MTPTKYSDLEIEAPGGSAERYLKVRLGDTEIEIRKKDFYEFVASLLKMGKAQGWNSYMR